MSKVRSYFKQQFQLRKFKLEHESVCDFHQTSFQNNQSALPSVLITGVLFLGCIGIMLSSFILTAKLMKASFWPIYLTHWGLVLITLTCGFGFAVSAKAYYTGPIDATFGLPWYIKMYWALYSTTVPIAIFITVFYWVFLTNDNQEYAMSYALDILVHGINSVIMVLLLLTSRLPSNLMHFYFSIILPIVYVIFSVIYYSSGGTDPFGNAFVYPVLDWSKPGAAMTTVAFCALFLLVLHILVTFLTLARDAVARSCGRNTQAFSLSDKY